MRYVPLKPAHAIKAFLLRQRNLMLRLQRLANWFRTLEEWLGTPLFHRGTSGKMRLIPTEAAELALPDIRAGFDRLTLGLERFKRRGE